MSAQFKDPTKSEALGLLMRAAQREATTLLRLAAVYAEGGEAWQAVKDAVDREYEKIGGQVGPPPATPKD